MRQSRTRDPGLLVCNCGWAHLSDMSYAGHTPANSWGTPLNKPPQSRRHPVMGGRLRHLCSWMWIFIVDDQLGCGSMDVGIGSSPTSIVFHTAISWAPQLTRARLSAMPCHVVLSSRGVHGPRPTHVTDDDDAEWSLSIVLRLLVRSRASGMPRLEHRTKATSRAACVVAWKKKKCGTVAYQIDRSLLIGTEHVVRAPTIPRYCLITGCQSDVKHAFTGPSAPESLCRVGTGGIGGGAGRRTCAIDRTVPYKKQEHAPRHYQGPTLMQHHCSVPVIPANGLWNS